MNDFNADLWLMVIVMASVTIGFVLGSSIVAPEIPTCAPNQTTSQWHDAR